MIPAFTRSANGDASLAPSRRARGQSKLLVGSARDMGITVEEGARRLPPFAVLSYAFRPLFLASGSWAVVGIVIWLPMFLGYVRLPTRFDPMTWHIHENRLHPYPGC